ncbi:MAG: MATE family efflux transporter [Hyphomicrobiales bacterium]
MRQELNPVSGKISNVFFAYAVPSIFALLSMASASIIDGFFVGNYVGSDALAAISISVPVLVFAYGIAVVFAAGGSVICGKYIGEGKKGKASDIFVKSSIVILIISVLFILLSIFNLDGFARFLSAKGAVLPLVKNYLYYIIFFFPLILVGFGWVYFVRVNQQPVLSSIALVIAAVLNFILDAIFIAYYGMGIKGAALATGIAQSVPLFILLFSFLRKKSVVRFILPNNNWKDTWKAAHNGFSEFLNETSTGIVTLLFNMVIMRTIGIDGVAAFSIINYLMYIAIMVSYGVGESLHVPVSMNYGARKSSRIGSLLKRALSFNFIVSLLIMFLLLVFPNFIVGLFLNEESVDVAPIAMEYIRYLWPGFMFSGISIALSGYFTSMHCPNLSAGIAILRSLVLPVFFLFFFERTLGGEAIFLSIPVAEAITMVVALFMLKANTPKVLVRTQFG